MTNIKVKTKYKQHKLLQQTRHHC